MNSDRCWMNIQIDDLMQAAKYKEKFYFVFEVPDNYRVFSVSAELLMEKLQEYRVGIMENKYSIYVDYRKGEIFARATRKDRQVVVTLQEVGRSVPQSVGDSDDTSFRNSGEDQSVEDSLDAEAFRSLRKKISAMLSSLDDRERAIIEQLFGLRLRNSNSRTIEVLVEDRDGRATNRQSSYEVSRNI